MTVFVAYNNNFVFTGLFLFFISKDLYLRMSFDIIDLSDIIFYKKINKKKAIDISKAI